MALSPSRIRAPLAAIVMVAAIVVFAGAGCTPLPSTRRDSTTSSQPGRGVYHTVRKGETLWRISRAYGVALAEITEANDLSDYTISIGQKLYIPGVAKTVRIEPATPKPEEITGRIGGKLAWPLAGRGRRSVTSGFGYREDPVSGGRTFHKGVDIDAAREERVLAAAAGEVVFSGRMSGFGTVVMVDHGDRLLTVYAHMSRAVVKLEDQVSRGQPVGYVGTTGRTTGSHLHFEVRFKGVSVNPLDYLP
jgi:murein DD-endopeptidase MepM/ murein hydrolase activator NlpD